MKKEPKYVRCRRHLMSGKSLTGIEALRLFDLYRLSSFIDKERKKGVNIQTDMSKGYGVYKLVKP